MMTNQIPRPNQPLRALAPLPAMPWSPNCVRLHNTDTGLELVPVDGCGIPALAHLSERPELVPRAWPRTC